MPEQESIYISLQEATKYCSYSQEYLSLRARQGKLKSVKLGRNWVTKKEWIEEYLKEVEEYKENLEIRKENLKIKKFVVPPGGQTSVKLTEVRPLQKLRFGFVVALVFVLLISGVVFGRESFKNVFETVDPYVMKISQAPTSILKWWGQASDLATNGVRNFIFQGGEKIKIAISENIENIKLSTNVISNRAKEIFVDVKNFYSGVGLTIAKIGKNFKEGVDISVADVGERIENWKLKIGNLTQRVSSYTYLVLNQIYNMTKQDLVTLSEGVVGYTYIIGKGTDELLAEVSRTSRELARDCLSWLVEGLKNVQDGILNIGKKIVKGFSTAKEFVKEKLNNTARTVLDTYLAVSEWVEEKLRQVGRAISQPFVKGYQFLTQRRKIPQPKEEVVKKEGIEKIIETLRKEIKEEFEELKRVGVPVKEVEKIIRVEPVKEITKEIIKIDDKELAEIKKELSFFALWGRDIENLRAITQKLQAHPVQIAVPTAPLWIGTPGLQVGGHGTFVSLGVSGSAGIGNLGVGGSTSLGSTAADKLTVSATSLFQAPATFREGIVVGAGALTIDRIGNLTTTGNIAIGNIIFDVQTGEIRTTGNFVDVGGATVRAVGERVFRAAASIYRYGMPAETASTSWVRVSKDFPSGISHPLVSEPSVLPGATRVYRLLINYSDDIATTTTSSWRIANSNTDTTIVEFSLPGLNAGANLNESKPHLTEELAIPNDNWQVDVRIPAVPPEKKIRIFNIFLVAYDRINQ